jgi:hypothetical protein
MTFFNVAILFLLLLSTGLAWGEPRSVFVPTGGNAWVVVPGRPAAEITEAGLAGWKDTATVCRFYIRFSRPGEFRLALRMTPAGGASRVRLSALGRRAETSARDRWELPGSWRADSAGYVALELQGIERADTAFGLLEGITITGEAAPMAEYVRDNEGSFFYWGRRGPSVHLNYELSAGTDVAWFYNEVTIEPGNDVIGSFFMANGFTGGYFGIQVNSESERRVLFSVWSPFATDDPASIPADQRIVLLRKGETVHAGEFGSEGSGGQSYLVYPWKAGTTYRFLLHARPDTSGRTAYTAWFFAPESGSWRLIASFLRPKTSSYLKGLHSFLENFEPETGLIQREGTYGNQWVRDSAGNWQELVRARFTADNTARKGYRKDYAGGAAGGRFTLRNCGFFARPTEIGTVFERPAGGVPPAVDPATLP